MKKLVLLSFIVIIPLFTITCKKDKDQPQVVTETETPIDTLFEGAGEFVIDGEHFELNGGEMVYFDDEGDSIFFYKLVLYSSGITVDDVYGYKGSGSAVYISMASSQQYVPAMRSYNIIDIDELYSNDVYITVSPEYDTADDNPYQSDYYICTSGTLVMSSGDGIYELTVDANGSKYDKTTDEILEEDIPITMNFDGNIELNQKK